MKVVIALDNALYFTLRRNEPNETLIMESWFHMVTYYLHLNNIGHFEFYATSLDSAREHAREMKRLYKCEVCQLTTEYGTPIKF